MKKILLILITLTLLIAACTPEETQVQVQDEDNMQENTAKETKPVETEPQEQASQQPQEDTTKEDLQKETPKSQEVKQITQIKTSLSDVTLRQVPYSEDEKHELTFIYNDFDTTKEIALSILPECKTNTQITIVINKEVAKKHTPICQEQNNIILPTSYFENGPNKILLRSKVAEDYETTNVALLITNLEEQTETLNTRDFTLKYNDEDSSQIDSIGSMSIQNTFTKTVSINKIELEQDIILELNSEKDQTVQLQINDQHTLEHILDKGENTLTLAKEFFKAGNNEIVFAFLLDI